MKPREINEAIVLKLGWTFKKVPSNEDMIRQGYQEFQYTWWYKPDGLTAPVPNFYEDLNACKEMENSITDPTKRFCYEAVLHALNMQYGLGISVWETVHASAPQRCEAFLKIHE